MISLNIPLSQITDTPKEICFAEEVEKPGQDDIPASEFSFAEPVAVSLVYYRAGRELFFHGQLQGRVRGICGRCVEDFFFAVVKKFDFVLTPDPLPACKSRELTRDELGMSFYSGDEVDLAPFIREQALLALPLRSLCDENCRGLCPGCGVDLNHRPCSCSTPQGDPRMAVFRDLRVHR